MDVFVYLGLGLNVGRDEIEDALEAAFDGTGEVTGGGSGMGGSNVDLEVSDWLPEDQVVFLVREVLRRLNVATGKLVVGGKGFPIEPNGF